MSAKEGFLDRWSRLKQTEDPPPEEPAAEPPAPVEEDRPDEEILADLGLPHPDELKPGDDVTGFMAQAVPERLRRMALRQLWRSNPVLANVDGLVEYGEDYTDSALVVENLQTLYQVGKGMFHEPDEPVADDPDEAPAETVEAAPEATVEPEQIAEIQTESVPEQTPPPAAEPAPEPAEIPQPTRRRMSFT